MKYFLFFLLILSFNIQKIYSQNWQVINPAEKFNYQSDGDNIITATIWSDSIQISGSDSIYYLNTIFCDSCYLNYSLRNRPQFMQKMLIVRQGGIINLRDTSNLVIHTYANLNESWLYDSLNNITAQLINLYTDTVQSNSDSIKTILLSTGDSIKLSKNSGIMLFPKKYNTNTYYRLQGIEGRNTGIQVPKFKEFFDYDIGDMFERHGILATEYSCPTLMGDQGCFYIKKYTIVSKIISGDTIKYTYSGYQRNHCIERTTSHHLEADCWSYFFPPDYDFIDSSDHFLNKYNHQTMNSTSPFFYGCGLIDSVFSEVLLSRDTDGLITKKFSVNNEDFAPSWNGPQNEYFFYQPLSLNSDTLSTANFSTTYLANAFAAKVGLGFTFRAVEWCGGGIEEHLVAYRKGNDTTGIFTPDSIFTLGIENNERETSINILSNPASNILSINLNSYYSILNVQIFDVQGRMLAATKLLNGLNHIDTTEYSNGLYVIHVADQYRNYTCKFIIQH